MEADIPVRYILSQKNLKFILNYFCEKSPFLLCPAPIDHDRLYYEYPSLKV